MNFRSRRRDELELNLIPLIDVVFMLLIFFMLTTTFIHDRTLKVDLPVAKNGSQQKAMHRNHIIEIDQAGQIAVDGDIVEMSSLLSRLKAIAADKRPVVVWADAQVVNQKVVTVLDLARTAGITRIGLGTTPPK